ncbi:rhomboid family intramembrane serine protease [Aurantiacibacter sp. MUD11]|uniref:rhomboid family intramembrane serine protease n=1 Tax=Aurantiacibacter sp. MUD11 TaxID=3003265 RepID=UPI0022AAF3E9|nr:rhomboid family intramembrane serine protease [Aurantiacibacter sp. MUD11]WAT16797.1 rhomboid family intramembrane serine protease [Aurantiacibacter sp. MUD11]
MHDDRKDELTQPPPEETVERGIPKRFHLPGVILLALIWAAYLWHFNTGMLGWGLSAEALAQGRYENIVLHMFAHGGLLHIVFNSLVLFSLAAPVMTYMGPTPGSYVRFFVFYFLSGLAGAAMFLAFNPQGFIPMVGASGAISGLIGLAARLHSSGAGLIPMSSRQLWLRIWDFVKANLLLIALITVPILLTGGQGGIAWEAHLGGFLVGMLGARWFVDPVYR